jgi:D-aminopeptidase
MTSNRLREHGLSVGSMPVGKWNAITDVPGVRVGHTTLVTGEGKLIPGQGPVRTGVTVILPHGDNLYRQKVPAAVYTINGTGKATGFEEVRELGRIESPIAFTNTLNVGLVADALVQYSIRYNPEICITTGSVNVVVGETNDMDLNDLQGRHVRAEHVWAAIENASGSEVTEGAVGAGTGTTCFGWKGGIGTSSRVLAQKYGGFTVGALVQSNFGDARDLIICGVPVGKHILPPPLLPASPPDGSIMMALATDAPLNSAQLRRLCVRAAAGLARTGGVYNHSSGDFVIAFSTGYRIEHFPPGLTVTIPMLLDERGLMNQFFHAVAECVEEAIVNSLFQAQTVVGRDGHTCYRLPVEEVVQLISCEDPARRASHPQTG